MSFYRTTVALSFFASTIVAQTIYPADVWQTTWDRSKLFTEGASTGANINFGTKGAIGQADIVISDGTVYQQMDGFGATLTDSAAKTLYNLKNKNSGNYNALLNLLFNPADGAQSAGLSYLRIPMGASDLSDTAYSYDDTSGDTALSHFSIDVTPSYVFTVLKDIQAINSILKLHFVPWSPPAWMKSSGSLKGGSFQSTYVNTYAQYLLKALQAWKAKGATAYAISIQNEPENDNNSYPTAVFTASIEAQVGLALRTLLNNNGFSSTKIVGYEHNWDDVNFPGTLMSSASSAFSGASFHCYAGGVGAQTTFHNSYPSKEVYFTECAGTIGSDWWGDIKWQTSNLWIGAPNNWARSALMWSLAADGAGNPVLPGTNSCGGGCRGVVTVNSDGSYSPNQEFYGLAQANKAILPKDAGGPWGQRIGVTIGGSLNWALQVSAFKTTRTNSADWNRYSIVVLNWDDSSSTTWNPVPVTTTIEFRGVQATVTFPVGVTTLWWYAAA